MTDTLLSGPFVESWSAIRRYLLVGMLCLVGCSEDEETSGGRAQEVIPFLNNHTILLANAAEARSLMQSSDEYTQQLGLFDLQSKTQNTQATREADYLDYAAQQALDWTDEEIRQVRTIVESADARISALGLRLALPSEIILVRSTMQEEGGAAGYTRRNFIVLGSQLSEYLFLHELFHVYSRANPAQRDALYATIGFRKTNEIALPEPLASLKISNPDAPVHDHVLEVSIDGTLQEAIFLIYSEQEYKQGTFFDYLHKRLLLVEGSDTNKQVRLRDGHPVLRNYDEATDLRDKIGRNTNYDIDPEEVIADHFTLLVLGEAVPEPDYLDQVQVLLQTR